MLPLSLYYSDEFRLLTTQQLLKAVQQAALCDSENLREQLSALNLTFYATQSSHTQSLETLPDAYRRRPTCIPMTSAQANHRFNVYLKDIEAAREHGLTRIPVIPLELHPNCSVTPSKAPFESILRKLFALAQMAVTNHVQLQLAEPEEGELELWLDLLTHLMPELPSGRLSIALNAGSKRLLPILGYLAKLAREQNKKLRVCISQRGLTKNVASSTDPLIDSEELIKLNFAAACAFLESEYGDRLVPELVITDPTLQPAITSLCRSHDWTGWVELVSSVSPTSDAIEALSSHPCTLRGVHSIDNRFSDAVHNITETPHRAAPIISGQESTTNETEQKYCPAAIDTTVGDLTATTEAQARSAFTVAEEAQRLWAGLPLSARIEPLSAFAQLLSEHRIELAALSACETGKTIDDALLEISAALGILRQHLTHIEESLAPITLGSSTGAHSELLPLPLGIVLGLLPWNQPILQFCSKTSAALLTGNAILLKPDTQASLVCSALFRLMLQTALPADLVALMPGPMETTGKYLLDDYRLAAVLFSGSPMDAIDIHRRLSKRVGSQMLPLMSDTGGFHAAMIDVDQDISELLPRLLKSAFCFAGQHPASLRILYIEEGIAEQLEQSLSDALTFLRIGKPEPRDADIGPVLSRERMDRAYLHIERFRAKGRLIAQPELRSELEEGYFIPPTLLRLYTIDELQEQVEAPILHLIKFNRDELERTIDELNRSGFAMAFTLFSNDARLCNSVERKLQISELNIAPEFLFPENIAQNLSGLGLSGTAPLPGTVDYMRTLIRHQRVTRPLKQPG
ncbi:Proline dehydrogenase (Proline oxidase) [Marinobacterium lacunae]|uniref:Proline dehydrogenase (Proline oxidase) n=1 Tax=Marinobacterium lacunae TaxID=1232683 RepID=A0A081FUZ9_9GAMM|nr:aldehyde dehydrogenase family protein [Marinobacterium lacunae]KEA62354.1 Proline dehydrogenase (Proline oxidase) [Marinobacterium lacunae]